MKIMMESETSPASIEISAAIIKMMIIRSLNCATNFSSRVECFFVSKTFAPSFSRLVKTSLLLRPFVDE